MRFGLSLLKTNRLLRKLNLHRTSRTMSVQTKLTLCRFPPADLNADKNENRRGNDPAERCPCEPADLTFCFVVGELVVGEAEPSLLEVLHSKPVSPLSSFYHKPEGKKQKTKFRCFSDTSLNGRLDCLYFYLIRTICQLLFLHLDAGIITRL